MYKKLPTAHWAKWSQTLSAVQITLAVVIVVTYFMPRSTSPEDSQQFIATLDRALLFSLIGFVILGIVNFGLLIREGLTAVRTKKVDYLALGLGFVMLLLWVCLLIIYHVFQLAPTA